ncbi:MAG: diguanylate cyclase [Gammaproteobacteria bacterium]|nr:diguanylate cyclase [Gammaproteobacteria bacterium]
MNNLLHTHGATEEELSTALRSKNRLLTFPEKLEKLFLDQHIPRSIRRFHVLMPVIFFLYAILITGIIGVIPKSGIELWLTIVISVTLSILCTMALSFFPRFNRWFTVYGVFGSSVVISATIIITNQFPLGQNSPLLYAGIIFAILIVYTCVGLTFLWGFAANLIGGFSAIVIMGFSHIAINWSLLNRIYICSSILGLGLSYALENQERKNFLNTLLLRITIKKGEDLAKQLESLSRLDSLTGIANRRHLDEILDDEWNRAMRQNQPLTIMLIDVDHFKLYNDKFGHLAGDSCLRQVAQLFARMTKRSGELAARYGGEEFVLVYPAMDTTLAKEQAARLLHQIASLALPHPNGHFVSFSIGLCVSVPSPEVDVAQLLHHADTALYQAKANGRNRYELYVEPSEDSLKQVDQALHS